MSEHTFSLGQQVITIKKHTWRVNGSDYIVEANTQATIVDFGRYSNDPHIEFEDGVRVTTAPKLIKPLRQKITVNKTFEGTQREVVFDIAEKIYGTVWSDRRDLLLIDLFSSQDPEKLAVLEAAEAIFEMFLEQPPTYDDDRLKA